jgi:hypothetical protein
VGDRITYVGLDVHKEGIVVAVAEGGICGEVRDYGRIANTAAALRRLVRKLGPQRVELRFCYEAGPCGYGIQRQLSAAGHDCVVVAPRYSEAAGRPDRDGSVGSHVECGEQCGGAITHGSSSHNVQVSAVDRAWCGRAPGSAISRRR